MYMRIEKVLSPEEAGHRLETLKTAEFVDGTGAAGYRAGKVKHNQQLSEDSGCSRFRSRCWQHSAAAPYAWRHCRISFSADFQPLRAGYELRCACGSNLRNS